MNIYTSDNAVTFFVKHKLQKTEGEVGKNTVIIWNLILHSKTD